MNRDLVSPPGYTPSTHPFADEILTVQELASLLKMSRQQVYEQTRHRARVRQPIPLPFLRVNGNIRFRRSEIYRWLDQLAMKERVQ